VLQVSLFQAEVVVVQRQEQPSVRQALPEQLLQVERFLWVMPAISVQHQLVVHLSLV
jgi:hypothetical protein